MKIPGAHLQMTSNKCTNFKKNLCASNVPGQNHVHRRESDRRTGWNQYTPPKTSFAGSIIIYDQRPETRNRLVQIQEASLAEQVPASTCLLNNFPFFSRRAVAGICSAECNSILAPCRTHLGSVSVLTSNTMHMSIKKSLQPAYSTNQVHVNTCFMK